MNSDPVELNKIIIKKQSATRFLQNPEIHISYMCTQKCHNMQFMCVLTQTCVHASIAYISSTFSLYLCVIVVTHSDIWIQANRTRMHLKNIMQPPNKWLPNVTTHKHRPNARSEHTHTPTPHGKCINTSGACFCWLNSIIRVRLCVKLRQRRGVCKPIPMYATMSDTRTRSSLF